jgi:NAD(P)H-dependent FMN reductase
MNIEIVAGSPREESVTRRIARYLQKHLSATTEHNVQLLDVRDWALPLLQEEVFTSVSKAPETLQPLAARMFNANAFLLVSPEYNGSYTPALKILFDHFPKQSRKAFGIITSSTGPLGGIRASQQMQLLIHALFGIGSPYMLVTPFVDKKFDEAGNLLDPAFQKNIDVFVSEFLWLAQSIQPINHPLQ